MQCIAYHFETNQLLSKCINASLRQIEYIYRAPHTFRIDAASAENEIIIYPRSALEQLEA